ncbi:hypothetical protein BC832DRAFT_595857 [Gaertneriomyces semiglobifer]|nr:hypothetical protein BC832DRAFT_595857 [Gaertneriomyces semiglobifer]
MGWGAITDYYLFNAEKPSLEPWLAVLCKELVFEEGKSRWTKRDLFSFGKGKEDRGKYRYCLSVKHCDASSARKPYQTWASFHDVSGVPGDASRIEWYWFRELRARFGPASMMSLGYPEMPHAHPTVSKTFDTLYAALVREQRLAEASEGAALIGVGIAQDGLNIVREDIHTAVEKRHSVAERAFKRSIETAASATPPAPVKRPRTVEFTAESGYSGFDPENIELLSVRLRNGIMDGNAWVVGDVNLSQQFNLHELLSLHSICLVERNTLPKWAPNLDSKTWMADWDARHVQDVLPELSPTALSFLHHYNRCVRDGNLGEFNDIWTDHWRTILNVSKEERPMLIAVQIIARAVGLSLLGILDSIDCNEDTYVHCYLHELLTETLRDEHLALPWANGESEASRERRQQYGRKGGKKPDFRAFILETKEGADF